MNKIILLIAALLVPVTANAGTFFRYGVGIFHSADYSSTAVKSFSTGYIGEVLGPIIYQGELGYFGDSSGHDRNGSGFGNVGLGVEANPGVFILRSTWAVGAITSPDAMLGGPFQFNHDFLFGVKGDNGAIIGLDLKHISSAGLESPNLGRDFLLLHVELPF
jgi:hypothetical protein